MRKYVFGSLAAGAAVVAAFSIIAARKVPTVRANTYIGNIALGGLTREEAAKQVRVWWETEKRNKLQLHLEGATKQLSSRTPGDLGVTVDDVATAAALPMSDLASDIQGSLSSSSDKMAAQAVYKSNGSNLAPLGAEIHQVEPVMHPAMVRYEAGAILKSHEMAGETIDWTKLLPAVTTALNEKKPVEIPLKVATPHITDDQLAQIKDVIVHFTTHFPTSNRPRCSNIKLASSKLNGVVLLPGERLSFNGTVGRRTIRAGFKLAGVYKNGKHDVGIGGGICQVSTTLYNASLLADLKIRQRSNHSLPVAYVPLGRDATVDYGSLDLIVENSYSTPIAVSSHYVPGQLTFTILGTKNPGLSVKIEQVGSESWDQDTETVIDHNLRPGARRIVEDGSRGHAVSTYRLVYQDGKLLKRESLGRSSYGGQTRVVAVNPAPRAPKPTVIGVPPMVQPGASASSAPGIGG